MCMLEKTKVFFYETDAFDFIHQFHVCRSDSDMIITYYKMIKWFRRKDIWRLKIKIWWHIWWICTRPDHSSFMFVVQKNVCSVKKKTTSWVH